MCGDAGGQFLAAVEEGEFDEEAGGDDFALEFMNEANGGGGGATGGEEVVDEENFLTGKDGVLMNFDFGFAVFEGVTGAMGIVGEFTGLAEGDEAGVEAIGNGGAEDEAPGVDTDDFVDPGGPGGVGEEGEGELEEFGVSKDGGDVFEDDSGFGKVRDIPNSVAKLVDWFHGQVAWGSV